MDVHGLVELVLCFLFFSFWLCVLFAALRDYHITLIGLAVTHEIYLFQSFPKSQVFDWFLMVSRT